MSGPIVNIEGVDLDRVHFLYTMKGALAKDVAFSLRITVKQVYAALSVRHRGLCKRPKPEKPVVFKFTRRRNAFHRQYSNYDLNIGPDGAYVSERTRGAWEVFWTTLENCKPGHVRRKFNDTGY